jgi:hypothetical protein
MTTTYRRDKRIPLIEQVRELAFAQAHRDDLIDFVPAALALGCSEAEADAIDEELTIRMMHALGAI